MKLKIDRSDLFAALSAAQSYADTSDTPQRQVLLEAKDGAFTASATDLLRSIEVTSKAQIEKPGQACINAKHAAALVRTLPDKPIVVEALDNHWVQLSCGRSEFKLLGTTPGDFTRVPKPKGVKWSKVDGAALGRLIASTAFSICRDVARPNLSAALFESNGEALQITSTDGHRLTHSEAQVVFPKGDRLLPRACVLDLKAACDAGDPEVGSSDSHFFIRSGGRVASMKMAMATFPPYRQVIPDYELVSATVDRAELSSALQRALIMGEVSQGARFTFSKDGITISTNSDDRGVSSQVVEADCEVDCEVGLNQVYVQDAVEACGTDKVRFYLDKATANPALSPVVIRPTGDDGLICVVMPIRL